MTRCEGLPWIKRETLVPNMALALLYGMVVVMIPLACVGAMAISAIGQSPTGSVVMHW